MNTNPSKEELKAENNRLKQLSELYKEKYEQERRVSQKLGVYSRLAPVAIIDWSLDFKVEYWNNVAEEIFGFKVDEAMGKFPWELVEKDDGEDIKGIWEELFETKGSKDFICDNFTKSGKRVICDWRNAAIFHEEKLVGFTSVVIDITKQKQIEQELLESNERFKKLSNVSFEAIFLSENGYGIDVNEVGIEMFGYSLDEIKRMYATDLFTKESGVKILQNALSGYLEPYEAVGVKKDGAEFPVEVQGKNYLHHGRNIRVTAIRDISERKKSEYESRNNEVKFKTIFDNVGYGIVVAGADRKVIDVNNSFTNMSGYEKDEILGKGIGFLFTQEVLKSKPLRFDIVEAGEAIIIERPIMTKKGREVPIEMNTRFVDKNYYVTIFTDLTERKKAEKALHITNLKLKDAKERAEESNNLKSAFLQNMSHEIRTPMNGIIGFSQLLDNPDNSVDRRKFYTNLIIKSSKRLLGIVNDILDISKLEAGVVELDETNTNINKMLNELFTFYQQQAWDKNINLHLALPLDNDRCYIVVDFTKLRQVLSNLLSNAIKFTEKGYVKLGYMLKGEKIEFYVEDTGIGINSDLHDKIFERFRQGDVSSTRKYGGTGLGLSISQANVKLLRGKLNLKSKKDRGSIFYFSIPFKKPVASEDKNNYSDDEITQGF